MSLGKTLSNLITSNQLTQKRLAAELNIAPTTLNGYIRDFREPDILTICQLADYFDVTVDYLIGRVPNDENSLNCKELELLSIYRCLIDEHKELLIEQGKLLIKMRNKKRQG